MEDLDFNRDCATLRSITDSIIELRTEMISSSIQEKAASRGYFLPDEDDWSKRMFVAYRNYRIAVYDIVKRRQDYENKDVATNASSFLLGFAGAVLLYHWSGIVVESFKDIRRIREKLNEGDARFGIEPGLFDTIYRNTTRISIQEQLADAASYYEKWYTYFRTTFMDQDHIWLMDQIDELYSKLKQIHYQIWTRRIDRELDIAPIRLLTPIKNAMYRIQSFFFDVFGNIWLDHIPNIPSEHIKRFHDIAEPGDFFIVRPERKSSTVFLPGWWTHAAVFTGSIEQLQAIGATSMPNVRKAEPLLRLGVENNPALIIEALSAGIVLNSLERSLHVDHVALFSPQLTKEQRCQALDNIFAQLGKPYDFEFDFSRSDRLVCTEVIYRGFHKKGNISFSPTFRMGHPTLSADDIVTQIVQSTLAGRDCGIRLKAISYKAADAHSRFLEDQKAFTCLQNTIGL